MKKYRCECKSAKCEVEREDKFNPKYCTCFCTKEADWQEVEEEKAEVKAEELPSWCKVGKVVYYNDSYYTIVEMNGQYEVKITDGVEDKWVKTSNVLEARLRPFNETEMRELVGKIITNKIIKRIALVISSSPSYVSVYGEVYNNEQLLDIFTFKDGRPCGVYEHKKNGEWVK